MDKKWELKPEGDQGKVITLSSNDEGVTITIQDTTQNGALVSATLDSDECESFSEGFTEAAGL